MPPPATSPRLYHADAETMLAVLRAAPDVARVLMLGHQPGIGDFARRLLADPPADPRFEKYATTATAVIDFDIPAWPDATWGVGRLEAFTDPRALE